MVQTILKDKDVLNLTPSTQNTQIPTEIPVEEEEVVDDSLNKLPILNILGINVDVDTFKIFVVSMISWIFIICILFFTGLWEKYFIYFILFYYVLAFLNLINNSNNVVSDQAISLLQIQGQDNFVQGSISMFILVFVFLDSIKIPNPKDRFKIYKLLIITLLLSATSLFVYNYKNDTRNIRALRKTKQFLFNQSLVLFCICLYMIFRTQQIK
jgi:hypothetical protein